MILNIIIIILDLFLCIFNIVDCYNAPETYKIILSAICAFCWGSCTILNSLALWWKYIKYK